jgi:hypothetical protein
VLGQNAIDALGLADAVRQRQRPADHLIRLLRVDPEREDQLDRLIELRRRERFTASTACSTATGV